MLYNGGNLQRFPLVDNPLVISPYSDSGGSGGFFPPTGYLFLIDNDGMYITDNDGMYLIAPI